MRHHSGDGVQRRLAGISAHLDIAESMIREGGLIHFLFPAPQRVPVRGFGRSQVGRVKAAVVVEHLAVPERDGCASRTAHTQPYPSGDVLAEIEDDGPVRTEVAHRRPDLALDLHGRRTLGLKRHCGPPVRDDRCPPGIVELRAAPPGNLTAGVIRLAHKQVGLLDRAGRPFP